MPSELGTSDIAFEFPIASLNTVTRSRAKDSQLHSAPSSCFSTSPLRAALTQRDMNRQQRHEYPRLPSSSSLILTFLSHSFAGVCRCRLLSKTCLAQEAVLQAIYLGVDCVTHVQEDRLCPQSSGIACKNDHHNHNSTATTTMQACT